LGEMPEALSASPLDACGPDRVKCAGMAELSTVDRGGIWQ